MNFNIFFGNHHPSGKKSIFDFISWIYLSLKELDFNVSLSNSLCENSINLIFDNFYHDTYFFLKQKKIRYGLICTETPTENTFNNYYEDYWINRRKNFDKLIDNAEFIWTTWGIYKPFENINKNYGYLELTYNKFYEEKYKQNILKTYDFAFSGLVNDFRRSVLDDFHQIGKVNINNKFKSKKFYNSIIEQANFSLAIQQSLDWKCMPTTKIMNSLHLGTIPIIFYPDYHDTSLLSKYCLLIKRDFKNIVFNYSNYKYLIEDYKKRKSKTTLKKLISETVALSSKKNFSFINSDFMGQKNIKLIPNVWLIRNFIFINLRSKKFHLNSNFNKIGFVIYSKPLIYILKLLLKLIFNHRKNTIT